MEMHTEENNICPLKLTMNLIGGKWKLSIICLLKDGKPMRYNQIKRGVPGITNVMLSQSLKHLEEHDVVSRQQYNEVPVRVEYQLTENGRTLLSVLSLLSEWGNQYIVTHSTYTSHCSSCLIRKEKNI
ncbi:MAG: helix-turn-helix domain-containing protein [Anaerotignum sp.]|nr:helix-turn-helix domain-containing protein [Anaerotignum sp.]